MLRANTDGGMNRGIYSAATGMIANQQWLDTVSNNLANASTTGYKRDMAFFNDALQRELQLGGAPMGSIGSGAVMQRESTVFERGPLNATSNPLDMAIEDGKGMFGIQTPQGIRYTRDGSFQLNENRELVTKEGFPVLDDQQQPITLTEQGVVSVGSTGEISVGGQKVAKLGIFDGIFVKEGGNLYQSPNASATEEITVKGGALEGSNVNAVQTMIDMIKINRSFEMSQKTVTQQDELLQKLIQSAGG